MDCSATPLLAEAGFLPRDFIETQEGLMFSVVIQGMEEGRVLGILRYVKRDAHWYKVNTQAANAFLTRYYSQYLYYSRRFDARLHGVPVVAIVGHYRPSARLRQILSQTPQDKMEAKTKRLLQIFEAGGLFYHHFGVTGSLLIGLQQTHSDIDLAVYGRENFQQARQIIKQGLRRGQFDSLNAALWREVYARRHCSLRFQEYLWHEQRKYNKAVWEATKFDIVLVLRPEEREADPRYFCKQGKIKLRVRVKDARGAFDEPAFYLVEHPAIDRIVAFSHTYVGQAETGEWVETAGQMEQASDGQVRIIVGSSREAWGEYIKVIASLG